MNSINKKILVLVVLLFFAGCAKEMQLKFTGGEPSPLPEIIKAHVGIAGQIKTFKGLANFQISAKGMHKNLQMAVAAALPDKVRIDLIDPLAGVISTVISLPNEIFYIDSEGLFYKKGSQADDIFRELTQLPWGPKEMIRVLAGSLPVKLDKNESAFKDVEGRYWIQNEGSALLWTDDSLEYYQVENGKVRTKIEYSGYAKNNGKLIPSNIILTTQKPARMFSLEYSEIEINKPIKAEIFKP